MMAHRRVGLTAVVALVAAGCAFDNLSSPSSALSGMGSLAGIWTSIPGDGSSSSCTNFSWTVDQESPTLLSGAFSAVCGGSITVSGTASGELDGSTLAMHATGTASAQGVTCPFSLNGTGYLEGDSIRIPYTGQTCVGPIQGQQTLRRQ